MIKKAYIILFVMSWIFLAFYFTSDVFSIKVKEKVPMMKIEPAKDSVIVDTVYVKVLCDTVNCDTLRPQKKLKPVKPKKRKRFKYYRKPRRRYKIVMEKSDFYFRVS